MIFSPEKLKERREALSLTQTDVILELYKSFGKKLSRQTLANWESGVTFIDAETLAFLALLYKKSVGYFFVKEHNQTRKETLCLKDAKKTNLVL